MSLFFKLRHLITSIELITANNSKFLQFNSIFLASTNNTVQCLFKKYESK